VVYVSLRSFDRLEFEETETTGLVGGWVYGKMSFLKTSDGVFGEVGFEFLSSDTEWEIS
jgi:hypothetical protein